MGTWLVVETMSAARSVHCPAADVQPPLEDPPFISTDWRVLTQAISLTVIHVSSGLVTVCGSGQGVAAQRRSVSDRVQQARVASNELNISIQLPRETGMLQAGGKDCEHVESWQP